MGCLVCLQEVVQRPLQAAKVEAASARKGIGLVKVTGTWGSGQLGVTFGVHVTTKVVSSTFNTWSTSHCGVAW